MLAIKGTYDNGKLILNEKAPMDNAEVIVVFNVNNVSDIEKSIKKPRSESRGVFKGKIRMSNDFDEPLEEMKEYME